ncbi:MAG: ABC transporter permease [Rhizobacter sp.]|nr:ABC transporter permease [Rhizobacter sp.]
MLKLEARPEPSRAMSIASPLIALAITVVIGTCLFLVLGKDPLRGLAVFFVEPVKSVYALTELAVKATPLLLIALGLAVCFRSNVWNIGAEGQFILGAIFASGAAMQATPQTGGWFFVVVIGAGVVGGMVWAAIVALLRDRFNANEILVSLMLVYVAEQVLNYLVYGPWKDPAGYNFPQTITFLKSTQIPRLFTGFRVNIGLLIALAAVGAFWVLLFRTYAGFQLQVGGLAPLAARYAGFSSRRALWTALLLSGGAAGLAGALEAVGPLGQLTPHVPAGYGFAAIIVAFVGRLHPVGIVFSALLMSMFYIGGELAQSRLGLPKSITGVFQGLLLFTLLACDTLIVYRIRWKAARAARPAAPTAAPAPVGRPAGASTEAAAKPTALAAAAEATGTSAMLAPHGPATLTPKEGV